MDRDYALRAARKRFERDIWSLLRELEAMLRDLKRVTHFNIGDARAVGSALNAALPDAARAVGLGDKGLKIDHCWNGRSNKIVGYMMLDGTKCYLNFELHLCRAHGETSKLLHQFADYDIEHEPTFPGFKGNSAFPDFEGDEPPELLLFIACFLDGTGTGIERAFLKFADGLSQGKIEIFRGDQPKTADTADGGPEEGPEGATLKVKKPEEKREIHDSGTDQREDANPSP